MKLSLAQKKKESFEGGTRWSCKISLLKFRSARFSHTHAKWHRVAVLNFWFAVLDSF